MQTSATLNPILTDFANLFMRQDAGFVAKRVLPYMPVALQSASFYRFLPADIANVPLLQPRAPGAPYPRLQTKVDNDNYKCEDYGVEAPAPDEERKKYASYFDLDKLKVNRIVDTQRVNHEIRTVNLVNSAAIKSAAIAIPWNDPASNPKGDVDAAKEAIRQASGMRATTLVISEPTFLMLQAHPKLTDLFKYTTPGLLNEDKLAAYFGLREVVVAWNVQAINNEGQAFVPADIWGNMAFVAAVVNANDMEVPTFGRTFHWSAFTSEVNNETGGTGPAMTSGGGGPDATAVFTYRDETIKADVHRADDYEVEKLVCPGAGFRLDNCLQ